MTDDPTLRQAARSFLAEVEHVSAVSDRSGVVAWVVETIDPDLRADDPNRRRLIGPYFDELDALTEANRIETDVNPQVSGDGFQPLAVAVVPLYRPDAG